MTNNRDGPRSGDTNFAVVRPHATPMLSEIWHSMARALQWWRQRQQQRRELKLLCAREFAAYGRAIRPPQP